MNKIETYTKILLIAKIIKNKGGNYKHALSLIKNNPGLLSLNEHELETRLYLILNHASLYAILYVENNGYSWSILKDNQFGSLVQDTADKKNNDYIIEMILDSINKYQKISGYDKEQTLEEKMQQFQLVKKNEEGYHLK